VTLRLPPGTGPGAERKLVPILYATADKAVNNDWRETRWSYSAVSPVVNPALLPARTVESKLCASLATSA
jgi:hypothetical protein